MTKITTISSQRFLNDETVEAKRAAKDYEVAVSPAFEIDGETYRVVLDGHHSLEAAKLDDVKPDYTEYDRTQHDAVALILNGDIETFLEVVHFGGDYYDVATGKDIW